MMVSAGKATSIHLTNFLDIYGMLVNLLFVLALRLLFLVVPVASSPDKKAPHQ